MTKESKKYTIIADPSIFDLVDGIVMIADSKTGEIYYLNENAKKLTDCGKNYKNKKCFELFENQQTFCADCSYFNKLNKEDFSSKTVTSSRYNALLGIHFLLRNITVKYNEKICILQYGTDLSQQDIFQSLETGIANCNEVITEIDDYFDAHQNIVSCLNFMVSKIQSTLQAKKVSLYLFYNKEVIEKFSTSNDDYLSFGYSFYNMSTKLLKQIGKRDFFVVDEALLKKAACNECLEFTRGNNIDSAVFAPVFFGDNLAGNFFIEKPSLTDHFQLKYFTSFVMKKMTEVINHLYLNKQQNTDDITGLLSQEAFNRSVEPIIKKFINRTFTFLELDINNFKIFNFCYEKAIGDEVLKAVGKALNNTKNLSRICRINGTDKFCLLVIDNAETTKDNVFEVLKTVVLPVDEKISYSLGLYQIDNHNESLTDIQEKAILAHSHSKMLGSQYYIYNDELLMQELKNRLYVDSFKSALANGEFKLFIQPKYDAVSDSFYSGEILVRWVMNGKVVSPGEFIPLFERNGYIRELDRYVLINTLKVIKKWSTENNIHIPLAVNLSRINFYTKDLFEEIIELVDFYKVPHDLIQFEITESVYVHNHDSIVNFVKKCHSSGIAVLMDDFGKGESSLASIKDLEIDTFKLDYLFLSKTQIFERGLKVISAMLNLGSLLGMNVVIEGVETEDDATKLKGIGCRYFQGYYYARPFPVEDFINKKYKLFGSEQQKEQNHNQYGLNLASQELVSNLLKTAINPVGIFLYKNGALVLKNGSNNFSELFFSGIDYTSLFQTDLFSLLNEHNCNLLKTYLDNVVEGKNKDFYVELSINTKSGNVLPLRLCATNYMSTTNNGVFLFVQFSFLSSQLLSIYSGEKDNITDAGLSIIFNNSCDGYVGIDEQHNIVYCNDSAINFLGNFNCGDKCSCFQLEHQICDVCLFFNIGRNTININKNGNHIYNTETEKFLCNRKQIYLTKISPSPAFQSQNSKSSSMTRVAGLISSIATLYFDINLETGEYHHFGYSQNSGLSNDFTFTQPFDNEIFTFINKYVEYEDQSEFAENINLNSLKTLSTTSASLSLIFKIKNEKHWYKLLVHFSTEDDATYASLLFVDDTDSQLKELDSMTDLLNRSAGEREVSNLLHTFQKESFAFYILDIDAFKSINDVCGHPNGDLVIKTVAESLKSLPANVCCASRMGGDEFSFVVKGFKEVNDYVRAKRDVEDIIRIATSKVALDVPISVSIGFAIYPDDGNSYTRLYQSADKQLYEEKREKKLI